MLALRIFNKVLIKLLRLLLVLCDKVFGIVRSAKVLLKLLNVLVVPLIQVL